MGDMNIISIGEPCSKCGADEWAFFDNDDVYMQICTKCGNLTEITKIDYLRNFQCSKCNCFSGTIEENDKFLAIRCKNCGEQHIMLEKRECENLRHPGAIPQDPNTRKEPIKPKCPTCSSTNITKISATSKAINIGLFGIFGNKRKKTFHCNNCKYEW